MTFPKDTNPEAGATDEVPSSPLPPTPAAPVVERPVDRRMTDALARADRGDRLGAINELGRALEDDPDNVALLCARGSLYMLVHRLDPAEADIRRAVKLEEANPEAQLQLGVYLSRRARWREAIEPLQRAIALNPTDGVVHYQLGEAYNQTDQLREALGAYEMASQLQPDNWRALKGIGIVLDRLGRPDEATAAYQKSREVQRRS
jgi:Flp pilus assembly protein TadD